MYTNTLSTAFRGLLRRWSLTTRLETVDESLTERRA